MRAAVAAGAGMINDVYALRREGALDAAAALGVPVVLMHMLGEPGSMQQAPRLRRRGRRRAPVPGRAPVRRGDVRHREEEPHRRPGFRLRQEHRSTTSRCWRSWSASANSACRCWRVCRASARIGEITGRDEAQDRVAGSVAAAPDRRAARRHDPARARRRRHGGCAEGVERGRCGADAARRSRPRRRSAGRTTIDALTSSGRLSWAAIAVSRTAVGAPPGERSTDVPAWLGCRR